MKIMEKMLLGLLHALLILGTGAWAQSTVVGQPMEPKGQWEAKCQNFDIVQAQATTAIRAHQEDKRFSLDWYVEVISTMGWYFLNGCAAKPPYPAVAQNYAEAKYWFDWGIQMGDAAATHNLAWMYQNGLGVPKDLKQAQSLYEQIIRNPNLSPLERKASQANLGLLLNGGTGTRVESAGRSTMTSPTSVVGQLMVPEVKEAKSCEKNEKHLNMAVQNASSSKLAMQNNPDYLKLRCRAYSGPQATAVSCMSAVDFFSYAGYFHSACADQKDYEEARYWYELGELGEDAASINNLAWLYQNGLGVEKDERKAARLYLKLMDLPQFSPAIKRTAKANLELLKTESVQQAQMAPQSSKPSTQQAADKKTPAASEATSDGTTFKATAFSALGPRKALVIGNDNYKNVPKLNNAREDAKAIASNLQALGYQVMLKTDVNEKEMRTLLRTFASQVRSGDEVLFFFAGHGVQLASTNYLLPIDILSDTEAQVRDEAIQLQRILDDMAERKAKFTLAIVDACRDNPFKTSGRSIGGRGLAPTTAATGQMIIFSAGSGQQALDKLGNADKNKNGLFTRVFIKEMQKPGLSVDRVLRNVRKEVVDLAKSVGHEQVPAIYDQVVGEFYFRSQ